MPKVCINRPNRTKPRRYTERDAGRIVCRVVSQGGDIKKLREEIEKCVDLCDKDRIRQMVQELLDSAIQLTAVLSILLSILGGISAIVLRIPAGRLLLPVITRLLRAQGALERGITIEGQARRILDELRRPP